MQFRFSTDSKGDVVVDIYDCALCGGRHCVPLLVLEIPMRRIAGGPIYRHRVRCPKDGNHILIPMPIPSSNEMGVLISADTPHDLIPHREENPESTK